MRYRVIAVCLAFSVWAAAQAGSVETVVATVRNALRQNHGDSAAAKALRRIRLVERLDDRTIETLESEGAGAGTVTELLHMRDASVPMPLPLWPVIPTDPPPAREEQNRVWKAAAATALHYTESLPNFICTEVVKRYRDPDGRESWHLSDTLLIKLSYFDRAEDYQLVSINNHPTSLTYQETGGAISEGEFGSLLGNVFAPSSHTEYRWDHWTTLRQRPALVYSFQILLKNAQYHITIGDNTGYHRQTSAGQHGFVYVDRDTNTVVRIVAGADSIPPGFPVQRAGSVLDYGFVEVGGQLYLLPLHAETRLDAVPMQHRNDVQFLDYKKFSADATISFGEIKKF